MTADTQTATPAQDQASRARVDRYVAKCELGEDLRDEIDKHPDLDEEALARTLLRRLKREQKDLVVLSWLEDLVGDRRRMQARAIEREAQRQAEEAERRARYQEQQDREERERAARHAEWIDKPWRAPRNTLIYRRWAQTPEGQERLRQDAEMAATRREREAEMDRLGWTGYMEKYHYQPMREQFARQARLELTQELLGSAFALGDGQEVTWGAAVAEEHVQRIELLMRNVSGNVVTVKLHEEAVRLIQEANVRCLSEVAERTVA